MISNKLQSNFNLIEMLIFPIWQKSSAEERERITKELGKMEAKMVLAEIEEKIKK